MGQKLKTPKGEISLTNFQGRIRLRWRHAGERFSLNLPYAYLPDNLNHASVKATEIKLDILKGCFDVTLAKYKPAPKSSIISSGIEESKSTINEIKPPLCLNNLVEKFNDWGNNFRNVDVGNSICRQTKVH